MFSNEQLQTLIEGKVVGDKYPYVTKDDQEIEAHIRRLFYRINRIPRLVCDADWVHFGSGYASFVEFFCYWQEDVTVIEEKHGIQEIQTNGLIIDVCRLAPVAIMGEDERYKTLRTDTNEVVSGAYSSLLDGPHRLVFNEKHRMLSEHVKQSLREFDYELLHTETLNPSLPFQTKISTIYRKPHQYKIMDAFFYWED